MSHWNHRVIKKILSDGSEWFFIAEVFYNDDKSIFGHTEEPVDICGDSIEEIKQYLQWCMDCLNHPILEEGKIEFKNNDGSIKEENC